MTPGTMAWPGAGTTQAGGNEAHCPDCPPSRGIPRWHVQEPYENLFITDEPLSYRSSSGKEMVFRWHYKQRYELPKPDELPSLYNIAGYTYYSRPNSDAYYLGYQRSYGMTNAGWAHNWMMDVTFWDQEWEVACGLWNGQHLTYTASPFVQKFDALVIRPEGGIYYFSKTNAGQFQLSDPRSQITLQARSGYGYPVVTNSPSADGNGISWGDAGMGFVLSYPDGSQDVFGLAVYSHPTTFSTQVPDSTSHAFLTARVDPQGRVSRVGYERVAVDGYTLFRVKYVVDIDGRTNTFHYDDSAPTVWAVSEVDDPYGRKTTFSYGSNGYTNGLLLSITDAATNTTTFGYWGTSGWVTNMTTPYGATTFAYYELPDPSVVDGVIVRATGVRQADASAELFCYIHNTNQVPATATPPSVPGQTFDDGTAGGDHKALTYRNTFHWNTRQAAALSSPARAYLTNAFSFWAGTSLSSAVASLTSADLNKGEMKHWRLGRDGVSLTESLSSQRLPSPDAAGQIEGARIWYNYAITQYNNNAPEVEGGPQVTCIAQTLPDDSSEYVVGAYSLNPTPPWGGRMMLSRSSYSKADGSVGELTNQFTYSSDGIDLLTVSNSVGQYVSLGYNAYHQATRAASSLGRVSGADYNSATHSLQTISNSDGSTVALSYYASNAVSPNGRMLSGVVSSPSGLSATFTWTNGQPRIVHRYGTGIPDLWLTNSWDALDRLTGTVFTDGTSVSNQFDRLHLGATKDRLGYWTRYGYDAMEHVTSITDPSNRVTQLSWCGCGALESVTDALTNTTSYIYNNQDLLTGIGFPDNSSLTCTYDAVQRLTAVSDGAGRTLNADYNNQGLITAISDVNGPLQSVLYDLVDRPIQITDAGNVTVTQQYDPLNRITNRIWPGEITESFGWSTNGLVAFTNRNQRVTRYLRDNAGRLMAVTNANLEVVRLGYNALSQVTDLWDGRTNHTAWHYNQFGWVTNKVDALTREVFRRTYDANGQVVTNWTPQFGNTAYGYDPLGNLKSIVYPDRTINYTYDAVDQLRTMADAIGTTVFSNTPTGNPLSEDGPWSADTVAYGYTEGLRTAMTVGSQSFGYGYDSAWRMYALASPGGQFTYGYEAARPTFLSTILLPNSAWVTNHYDALARLDYTALADSWGHVLDGYGYSHDALGQRTNIVRDLGLTSSSVAVGYDAIGQITSWAAKEASGTPRLNEQLGWSYDKSDNLLTRTNGFLWQVFNCDAVNELTNVTRTGTLTVAGNTPAPALSVTVNGLASQTNGDFTFAATNLALADGANSFTNIAANAYGVRVTNIVRLTLPASPVLRYDSNGNLTNDGTRSFTYDAQEQLTAITVTNAATGGSAKTEFVYDGLGRRRIQRDYAWSGGGFTKTNEVRFIYDGYLLVQERDTNNNVLVTYTRGLDLSGSLSGAGGIGGLLGRTDANGSTYYHADGSGNVTALIDSQQTMAARYMYSAFGGQVGKWGPLADRNTMQFSSMPRLAASGLSLYPFRAYDPSLQRWINQDPIGEVGGINLYAFVRNNSLGNIDSLGLAPAEEFEPERMGEITEELINGQRRARERERIREAEEQIAESAIRRAKEREMRQEGLDPSQTYIGAPKPPFRPSTAKERDEYNRDHPYRLPQLIPCSKETEPPRFFRGAKPGEEPNFTPRPNEFKIDPDGFVKPTHGVSVFDNPDSVLKKGFEPWEILNESVPEDLQFIQRGKDPNHFEIVPREGGVLTPEGFARSLGEIKLKL